MRVRASHLYLILALCLGLAACGSTSTCPPCNPEIKIVEVPHPYPVVLVLQMMPPLYLEPVPAMVGEDAEPEVAKANALAIVEARDRNHTRLVKRDEAWTMKVEHHNSLAEDVRRNDPE